MQRIEVKMCEYCIYHAVLGFKMWAMNTSNFHVEILYVLDTGLSDILSVG